jgi:hypothetical protein
VTDRYDDPTTRSADPAAGDDSARRTDAPASADDRDVATDQHGARSTADSGELDRDADDAVASGQHIDARSHVNARRSTHTELPELRDRAAEDASPRDVDAPQYGVGPFSVREVALLGIWAVTFLVSFFPLNNLPANVRVLGGGTNVWLSGLWWIPTVALPTVAVGLLALRRLSPQGIRRVGSLGIDQFASVAFSVSALVWVSWVWDTVSVAAETGIWTRTWVVWVGALLALAGVVLTVFAPIIPPFEQDFQGRPEAPAHRNARPVRAVVPRPARPRPVRTAPAAAAAAHEHENDHAATAEHGSVPGSYTGSTDLPHSAHAEPVTSVLPAHGDTHDTDVIAAGGGTAFADSTAEHEAPRHPHPQAFWALAPTERDVVDDYGTPIFRIGPTAWALVIEDRGETFVIRHDDGRIGYLHDIDGVTRG